jgi:hypothetical protein
VQLHKCLEAFATEAVFCEEVGGVDFAVDLAEVDTADSDRLLYP